MARVTRNNISELQLKLIEWFEINGRTFPWREEGLSNYKLIISEVLLQRTKAETVSAFYNFFITVFPDWKSIASAGHEDIETCLKPLGLQSQRAKRLKNLAEEIVNRDEVLPQDRSELESLPFIGQYLANSIELLIFGKPKPLLDVNMARLLERYFKSRKKADIRYDPFLLDLSSRLVDHRKSKQINWAVLDFAALICKALRPLCSQCMLKSKCTYNNSRNNS